MWPPNWGSRLRTILPPEAMTADKIKPTGQSAEANSGCYAEFVAQREEILKHKWIQSEKAGHDIGFEAALIHWVATERDRWRAGRKKA